MKYFIIAILVFFLASCTSSRGGTVTKDLNQNQVFLGSQTEGLPGKCYSKLMTAEGVIRWTQIYCENEITSKLVKQLQQHLLRIGFSIDPSEIDQAVLGDTTRSSFVKFQQENGLAYGGLDQATLYKIINSK